MLNMKFSLLSSTTSNQKISGKEYLEVVYVSIYQVYDELECKCVDLVTWMWYDLV